MGDAACHLDAVCLSCGRFLERAPGRSGACPYCGAADDPVGPGSPVVRVATAEDAAVVGALTEHAYRVDGHLDGPGGTWYAEQLRDASDRIADAVVLVAEVDGEVVATVTLAAPGSGYVETAGPDELEVRMLAVAPHARRRGIAEMLMQAANARARAAGLRRVVLCTEPGMHGAHRLYARLGYRRQPERDRSVDGYDLISYGLDVGR